VGPVGTGRPKVVVEDLPEDRPGLLRVGEEVVQLEHAGIVLRPQAAGATEGRDAALDADPRARKGGEVRRGADKGGGLTDSGLSFCGISFSAHLRDLQFRESLDLVKQKRFYGPVNWLPQCVVLWGNP